ncbi:MAG TPA: hypothetical protein PLD23_07900 [Armatimonadota bacterium]|nr:hypothetical protein [Armatimonadota bacterium]HQK93414.1 hypothetical protein [Armatimonadota bacterium]
MRVLNMATDTEHEATLLGTRRATPYRAIPAVDGEAVDPLQWALYRVVSATDEELAAFQAAGIPCHRLTTEEADELAARDPDTFDAEDEAERWMAAAWADLRAHDPTLPELSVVAEALESAAEVGAVPRETTVTLRNLFHGTAVQVRCPEGLPYLLPRAEYLRVRKRLCGVPKCRCGLVSGVQEVGIEWVLPDRGEFTWQLHAYPRHPTNEGL